MRGGFPDRPAVLITSVGLEENRWKDSVQTGDEIQLWVDDGTVQGMAAWFTKFNGVIPDTRWIEPMAEAFGRHADVAEAFAATRATAEIAVIDPATTHRLFPREEHARAEHARVTLRDLPDLAGLEEPSVARDHPGHGVRLRVLDVSREPESAHAQTEPARGVEHARPGLSCGVRVVRDELPASGRDDGVQP